jgi:hypothetical protein
LPNPSYNRIKLEIDAARPIIINSSIRIIIPVNLTLIAFPDSIFLGKKMCMVAIVKTKTPAKVRITLFSISAT